MTRAPVLAALSLLMLPLSACGGSSGTSGDRLREMAQSAGVDCSHYTKMDYSDAKSITSAAVCGAGADDPAPGVQLFTFDGDSEKAARSWAKNLHADVVQGGNWIIVDRQRSHDLGSVADGLHAQYLTATP